MSEAYSQIKGVQVYGCGQKVFSLGRGANGTSYMQDTRPSEVGVRDREERAVRCVHPAYDAVR